ncbi:hypothetical protein BaRGS_00013700, partial [Batillaria attramentaria]
PSRMFSRAHLLIEKEIMNMKSSPPWGVEIEQIHEDSIFEWMVKIHGLRNTLWEGGIFQVYIKFDEHYNVRPPDIVFQTVPFHPNVDMSTGRPCVDYLDDLNLWRPNFSLSMILTTLQVLLSTPNVENAVNMEAIQMMSEAPHAYRQLVLECVNASQRINAGESPHFEDSKVTFAQLPAPSAKRFSVPRTAPKRVTKLSFDDYHLTWQSIATSKPTESSQNELLNLLEENPKLQKVHMALPREELEEQMKRQMEEHKQVMFGRFKNKLTFHEEREAKLARLQQMKKIYLPPRHSPTPAPPSDIVLDPAMTGLDGKDEWEKEVDDLVDWSNNLDASAVDT